jgi:tetratricopeptide (TPR) repeat protein
MQDSFKNGKTNSAAINGGAERAPFKARFSSRAHLLVAGLGETRKFLFSDPRHPKAKTYEKLISSYKKSFEYVPTVQKAFRIVTYQNVLARMERKASNHKALEKIYGEMKAFCTEAISKLSANGQEKILFLHIFSGMANYNLAGFENDSGATGSAKYLYGLVIEDCTSSIRIKPNTGSFAYTYRAFAHEALGDIEKKGGNADAAKSHWLQADKDYSAAIKVHAESGLFKDRSEVKLKLGDKEGSDADLRTAATTEKQERIEEQLANHYPWMPVIIAGV